MRLYKYWAVATESRPDQVGEEIFRSANGFSNISSEDAFRVAGERAKRQVDFAINGRRNADAYYGGSGRPIREEIVQEFSENDQVFAAITRNSYGCLVLNTRDVFFADVDLPQSKFGWGLLGRLFGKKSPSFEEKLIIRLQSLVRMHPGSGYAVYRTLRGFRIVLTSETLPADDAKSNRLLRELGSDELYVCLCKSQDCYRARLTPKPWRCNTSPPPCQFPFKTANSERLFREWESRYDAVIRDFATCTPVGQFGSDQFHPRVAAVLQLHDHYTLNEPQPLA